MNLNFNQIISISICTERCMRPSESSVENDSIVFTYAQRFSKMPDYEATAPKKVNSKRPVPVVGLSLEKPDSEEQNKDVNSSDTENASPAIAYGPKDSNSVRIILYWLLKLIYEIKLLTENRRVQILENQTKIFRKIVQKKII